ncbi:DUF4163 domain-containing protein [Heliobacterium undosum]|uniref:DUF4163 domain-containing protein n=1 Tax=Heliomicrobium undosum TaxID=121734 RepID=A0A845L7X9_9FIRM|nr:stalk domain-containing protein [Heliomicrobium undosum]MZP29031.1 DUF4163 domain-containing protein [Heliomicrobium undosum]
MKKPLLLTAAALLTLTVAQVTANAGTTAYASVTSLPGNAAYASASATAGDAATAGNTAAVSITLNGTLLPFSGRIVEERTLVPLRGVSEALGLEPAWKAENQMVTLNGPSRTITMQVDDYKATVGDHRVSLDSPPQLIGDAVYVPLRFVSENLSVKVAWDAAAKTVNLSRITENAVTFKTVKEYSEDEKMIIDIQYPQIDGMKDAAAQERINRQIREQVTQFKQATLAEAEECHAQFAEAGLPPRVFSVVSNYEVKYNANNLVSLRFIDYNYLGGAHGMSYASSLTFDTTDGKVYELKDLFASSDYIDRISGQVKQQIKDRDIYLFSPFTSIDAKQPFYLRPDGIVVYYQLYELTAYAYGFPEFTIPYSQLSDLLTVPLR